LSAFTKEEEKKRQVDAWTITDKTGLPIPARLDTAVFTYPNENPMNNYSINYAYNGSLGSPLQSKIYFDRTDENSFLFSKPYDAYYESVSDQLFYKTSIPYSQLTYNFAGSDVNHDDFLRGLITVNPTPKLNFTGMYNYTGTQGVYYYQATKMHKAGLSGNYKSKWYDFNAAIMYHTFRNQENGGIQDEKYITNVDSFGTIDPIYIPTNLDNAQSSYKNVYGFYHQKIHLAHSKHYLDSVNFEYRPIVSLFTTSRYEVSQKRYKTTSSDSAFYAPYRNNFYNEAYTLDSTRVKEVSNTAGISINEGFTKWMPFSAIIYVEHDYFNRYNLQDTIGINRQTENDLLFGAELSKRQGEHLLFDGYARVGMSGRIAGDTEIGGKVSSTFEFLNQRIGADASTMFKAKSPDYFENTYYSNYFIWNNDFNRTERTNLKGNIYFGNKWIDFSAGAGVENINNYIYFGKDALPAQYSGDIQVVSAKASLNLKLGIFHWQNKAVYQTSSNEEILPLPEWSLYSNAFIAFNMFKKVLTTQIGADCYYSTAYYAPNYMPATGAFFLQDKEKVGDYPVMSAYLNLHLKTIRFYVKYYHFNALFGERNYFSMPNYPLYPDRLQFGISTNLWN
jgi:hypothetical protein